MRVPLLLPMCLAVLSAGSEAQTPVTPPASAPAPVSPPAPVPAVAPALQGPLIKDRAPENAQWSEVSTMRITSETNSPGSNATTGESAPLLITTSRVITKTGKVYHVRMTDGSTNSNDVWTDGKIVAMEPANGLGATFVAPPRNPGDNSLYVNFATGDFEGFSWLTPQCFLGTVKDKATGKDCLRFETPANEVNSAGDPMPRRSALIDAETRLPVSLEANGVVTTYTFVNTPPARQTFPSSIVELINEKKKTEESFARKPGLPY